MERAINLVTIVATLENNKTLNSMINDLIEEHNTSEAEEAAL